MAKGNRSMNPNSLGNLKPPWSSTNQPKNNGRKPSTIKKYIKENNISSCDVAAMAKFMLPLTKAQIQTLVLDDKSPFMMRLFAKALMSDLKNGNMENIMKIIDRAVGKPKEVIDLTSRNESLNANIDYEHMPEEEAKKLFFNKIQEGEEEV